MTGRGRFWHSLVDMDVGRTLKSKEFGIVVARGPVDQLAERYKRISEERSRFQRVFDGRMKEFMRDVGLGERGGVRYNLCGGEEPWLWGFDLGRGSAALYLSRNRNDPAIVNQEREAAYRTHNCDNLMHRGILISAFGIWAELIEAFAGLKL